MRKSEEQIQVFYEIAMVIGKSLNLHEMLKTSLLAYLRKLNCVAGMVYRIKPSEKSGFQVEDIFSIPYTLRIQKSYSEIDRLLSNHFKHKKLISLKDKLPLCGESEAKQYYHIMNLEDFGFLVLIKSDKALDDDVLYTLIEINNRLAQACVACINNEALAISEKRFRDLAELLPEMVCETDMDGRLTFVNKYAIEKFGYSKRELNEGFYFLDIFHPEEHEKVKKDFAFAIKTDRHFSDEYKAITKDGVILSVIVHTNRLVRNNKTAGMRGVMIDITKRKEYEFALQLNLKQQELLSEISLELNSLDEFSKRVNNILNKIGEHTNVSRVYIFEDINEGLGTCNTYEWCNKNIVAQKEEFQHVPYEIIPSWKKILFEKEYLYSENITELPEDVRVLLQPREIKSIIIYPLYIQCNYFGFIGFDECARHKNWSKSELEFLRTISGMIGNAYERRHMEQSIIDERDKANQANKAKSEFLANMSHEIRTPMNAILGFSEALYHKLDSRQHQKMIKSVLSSGNLLLSLLNDILDLSKIEAGKLEISPHPVNLGNILQEIKLLFTGKAQKKGIEINTSVPPGFPGILILDEIRIKQVVYNLVGNALKFTDQGYVNIKLGFSNESDNFGELLIEVEDTGIGIPEIQQESIFEAFRQQSGQSNRKYGGVGLGLAISRRLVEKMDGVISVSSTEGKGSVFKVIIPDVEKSTSEVRPKDIISDVQDITFEKAGILVVDDINSNIETVENLLSSSGLTISSAENGEIALEILNHSSPDLILLDIRMPGMDGYEVARHIKTNPKRAHIPIIAYTASVFSSGKIENSGDFDGVVYKPANRAELVSQLARFLKHQTGSAGRKKKIKDVSSLDKLPNKIMNVLHEINQILEEKFLPQWKTIKDQLVLFKIEEFAEELKQLALSYEFQFLIEYADKISEELDMVDIEGLKETLNEFPGIIKQISSLIKNTKA